MGVNILLLSEIIIFTNSRYLYITQLYLFRTIYFEYNLNSKLYITVIENRWEKIKNKTYGSDHCIYAVLVEVIHKITRFMA